MLITLAGLLERGQQPRYINLSHATISVCMGPPDILVMFRDANLFIFFTYECSESTRNHFENVRLFFYIKNVHFSKN